MFDKQFRRRAERILHNMALENTGWRRFLGRWNVNHEPLRNDAGNLLREAGYSQPMRIGTRLVGEDRP